MEHLGYIFDTPTMNKSGKWNPVELVYDEQDNFNAGTSKVLKLFKHPDGDGKCSVTDADGEKYTLDVTQASYDIYANSIKLFPIDCKKIK